MGISNGTDYNVICTPVDLPVREIQEDEANDMGSGTFQHDNDSVGTCEGNGDDNIHEHHTVQQPSKKSMFAMVHSTLSTLWRLLDGNRNLQSSIIIGLKKFIDRIRSGKGIDIQSWKVDEMNNDQSSKTENECPSVVLGMTSAPGRGRSVGRYKSNRENMFKKRKKNSDCFGNNN